MRTYLLVTAAILVTAAGPGSPGAETTVNTYARISADIPACKLRPLSWGKELRAK
jgi:hypothetical protein